MALLSPAIRRTRVTGPINPQDAKKRKIESGEYVRVWNDRGSFEGRAELTEDVMPGLVMANLGFWSSLSRTGNTVNACSADRHCNLGQAGTYSDSLVDVALV